MSRRRVILLPSSSLASPLAMTFTSARQRVTTHNHIDNSSSSIIIVIISSSSVDSVTRTFKSRSSQHNNSVSTAAPIQHINEYAFEVVASTWKFGHGVLRELGSDARSLGMRRVGVLSDKRVSSEAFFRDAVATLRATSGIDDVVVYDEVRCEPTDVSFRAAAEFVRSSGVDGLVSIGGGSVMDTAKGLRFDRNKRSMSSSVLGPSDSHNKQRPV